MNFNPKQNIQIPIYLISLCKDKVRRDTLKQIFPKSYEKFILIDAVDGRILSAKEYYDKAMMSYKLLQKIRGFIMSPSELGCTLSHIKALENFIKSNEKFAIILEDDIIGNDIDLLKIQNIVYSLDRNSIFICGGQDGVKQYLYGKKIDDNFYEVSKFSYKFICRTCCYVVTRASAKHILKYQNKNYGIADYWNEILKESGIKIYYANILKHPENLLDSNIEEDRIKFKKSLFHKLFSINAPYKIIRKFYYKFMSVWLRIIGYKKL